MKPTAHRIELTRSEIDYLKKVDTLPSTLLSYLEDMKWQSRGGGILEISAASAEEFRDAFSEQLARTGFTEDYEPNAEGRLLEDLIDRFFIADP